MANGPGLSWNAGVSDVGKDEMTHVATESTDVTANRQAISTPDQEGNYELSAADDFPPSTRSPVTDHPTPRTKDVEGDARASAHHELQLSSGDQAGGALPVKLIEARTTTEASSQRSPGGSASVAAHGGSVSRKSSRASGLTLQPRSVVGSATGAGSGAGSGTEGTAANAAVSPSGGKAAGGRSGGGGGGGSGGSGSAPLIFEPSGSLLEQVSREVIRKLRLAASADKADDRHVVCEELFADITCALDASALAALLGPTPAATTLPGSRGSGTVAGGGSGGGGAVASGSADAGSAIGSGPSTGGPGWPTADLVRGPGRGRLYYEVLAVHYATRAAADSARALLHLCQLLWDTPWVAPIYALLLHRFLMLPREVGTASNASPTGAAAAAAAPPAVRSHVQPAQFRPQPHLQPQSQAAYCVSSPYADSRVKHLNVLAHGARQLLLGDVHSGLFRFQPLWSFLTVEVAGLGPPVRATAAAASLPPVAQIDDLPITARPWLLAVAAAFLPYYCLDEHVGELARRFPPPLPPAGVVGGVPVLQGPGFVPGAESLDGFDFLVVEVTDVLGRVNCEAGLLKYLRALRALAQPPPSAADALEPGPQPGPPPPARSSNPVASGGRESRGGLLRRRRGGGGEGTGTGFAGQPGRVGRSPASSGGGGGDGADGASVAPTGGRRVERQRGPVWQPLDGLPTITKLRLQNELYSLTSGGGPRYAPPEVRKAAFAALDALFPGGRSLRWLVRWASRTLHLEWLESDSAVEDPWVGGGWLGWIYWPIHWCTGLYGRFLLMLFQVLYGIVVWRPWRAGSAEEVASLAGGTGGLISAGPGAARSTRTAASGGGGFAGAPAPGAGVAAGGAADRGGDPAVSPGATCGGVPGEQPRVGWWRHDRPRSLRQPGQW